MPRIYKDHARRLPHRPSRLRVIIADDHTILRQGLRAILEAEPDLEVIGEASNIHDAVTLSLRLQPDVVITDVSVADGSGIDSIGQMLRECAGVHVVMLTGQSSRVCERAAIAAGAYAYIVKDSSVEVLLRAIRSETSEYERSIAAISNMQNRRRALGQPTAPRIAAMTARELQVLVGVALGHSSRRIAENLGRSVKTVEKHRFNMMHKLGLRNAAAVTRFAMDNGLLHAGEQEPDLRPNSFPLT